ncbi:unnamed protein product [Brassicogethes aeneus]|uniref:Retinol dehydrogenase 13 n=1 Tax=Brassicogethes aeneus TaxID=1431903 RepID=A0A9P0BG94_BRAAE|nr:unnamed protein product [Brassicogethes aeneus]
MGLFSGKCYSNVRLDGKTAVITGSNTGIGKETVQDFFKRGCKVIMACRNLEKAQKAATDIKTNCGESENFGEILVTELDLGSLKSVRKCAKHILETEQRIDLLVNNAGVMMCPESRTEEGYEMQFGTNHLGHFLLTMLLLPKIIKSAPARIVNVSSLAHEMGSVDFKDINWEKKRYSSLGAYQQSKLANVVFTVELARRLEAANIQNVKTYSLHPGVIATELGRHLGATYFSFVLWAWRNIATYFIKTPEQGAQTTIYCAVDEACANESGLYYSDCATKNAAKQALKEETGKQLWQVSLKMVDLPEDFDPFK